MANKVSGFSALVLLVFLWCGPHQTQAFTPSRFFDDLAILGSRAGTNVRDGVSVTHAQMTEDAVLQVSADLLKDNPNPDSDVDSTARINALTTLTPDALVDAYFGESLLSFVSRRFRRYRYKSAIEDITDANGETDTGSDGSLAAAHFDSEQLQDGQTRLVNRRKLAVTSIQNEEYEEAREAVGGMLHTLQDFYSHTNWIEMGQRVPNTVLGKEGQQLQNIAPTTRTCSDCMRNGTVVFFLPAEFFYRCNGNILPEVNAGGILTSGYYTDQRSTTGQVVDKPQGKCSHGGFRDASSDLPATGGINKDSISLDWSPHANLHDVAAAVALQASIDILQDIRTDVQNDVQFAAFLNLELALVASIAYVIDTTGSMGAELPEIQATIPSIRMFLEDFVEDQGENTRVRFILVPFNDPDPGTTIVTEDIDVFLDSVGNLVATGGGDCPEPSIGALIRAIRASEPGSQIFVYTDAGPSDFGRLGEAVALIREKQVRITYILTGSCFFGRKRSAEVNQRDQEVSFSRHLRQIDNDAYSMLAATSGGQVFNVDENEISELSPLITASLVQVTSTIFYTASSLTSGTHTFSIDETVSQVIVSINGGGVVVNVTSPGGIDSGALDPSVYQVTVATSDTYVATVNVSDSSLYGQWQLSLTIFFGSYTIRVTAITNLDFLYTLYRPDPTSIFGFLSLEGNPLEGEMLSLFVQLEGQFEQTDMNTVVLLTVDGDPIESLNATDIGDGGYTTSFVTPTQPFQIQFIGVSNSSGHTISRISATGVDPDSEDIAVFGFTSLVYNVVERAGAEAEVTVELQRGNLSADVQVTVETIDGGTATVNMDYNSTTCVLMFPAGSGPGTMRSCFILIVDDFSAEPDETISVMGSTATSVLPFTTTVIITDTDTDDATCTATIGAISATEICTPGTVCCRREDNAGFPRVRCCPAGNHCGPYHDGLEAIVCLTISVPCYP